MFGLLSRHWWVLGLRGLLAVVFGVLALLWPQRTVDVVVILFGAYALVDGLFSLFSALTTRTRRAAWWLVLMEAVMGIGAGIVTIAWPELTAFVFLYLIAAWAILTGILELAAAALLRRQLEGEWALGIAGVISMVLGVLLALRPESGLVAVAWIIGGYAVVFGVLFLVLAGRLRALRDRVEE